MKRKSGFLQKLEEMTENITFLVMDLFQVVAEAHALTNSIANRKTVVSEYQRLRESLKSFFKPAKKD